MRRASRAINQASLSIRPGLYEFVRQPLLRHQFDVISDVTTPMISLTGGLGAGKTEALCIKALYLGYLNAPYPGLVIEPTYDQIENVFLDTLFKLLRNWNIPTSDYTYNSKTHNLNITLNGRSFTMRLRSADKAKNIAGANVAWLCVDEADFVYENIVNQLKGRVRIDAAPFPQICFFGTPERVGGWWQRQCEILNIKGHKWYRALTKNNFFLPDNFVSVNLAHLSKEERKQYMEGHWVKLNGTVYTNFKEEYHSYKCETPSPDDEFVMACDFGTGMMSWVLGVKRGDHVHFFDELAQEGLDTHDASILAAEKWRNHFQNWFGWSLSPEMAADRVDCYIDPAGNSDRKQTSSDSKFMEISGFNILSSSAQIPVKTRVSTLNYRIKQGKVAVDPVGCPYALKSLLHQGYDRNGIPEKAHSRDGRAGLDHSNDALGYLAVGLWPLTFTGCNTYRY